MKSCIESDNNKTIFYHKKISNFDFYIKYNSYDSLIQNISFITPVKIITIFEYNHSTPKKIKICFDYIKKLLLNKIVEINFNIFNFSDITDFQKKVLITLNKKVKFGSTVSYKKLAELSGCKNGQRAVGSTMKKNKFPIIFPCHRVIRSNGSLGGFQAGIKIKKELLNFEKRMVKS